MPIGTDLTQISTYDGSANLLSQQVGAPLAVVAGTANAFGTSLSPITLDANPGAITATAGSGISGSQPNFTVPNSSAVTFALSQIDAGGSAFGAQPGQPTMTNAAASGTGATASITGSTLTLTPPSSAASTNVVVEADPAGTQDVTTTLTASPAPGATSFSLASASGIYPGANLILDYETFSGATLLQETALVTNVSGTTITIASGLAHAHTLGASVRHYSDNLVSSANPFTVMIGFIMPIAFNASAVTEALVYNNNFSLQTGMQTLPASESTYAHIDANDNLYIGDAGNDVVYGQQYIPGTGFGTVTFHQGNSVNSGYGGGFPPGFDVSSNGTVLIENGAASTPELVAFAPGTSSNPTTFNSSFPIISWQTENYYLPTVSILTDRSSNVFGYAFDIWQTSGAVKDQIVVTNGSSEQDINSSALTSTFFSEVSNGSQGIVLIWDQGRQSLIYANAPIGGPYSMLEFPRSGTTGAVLSTTPTTIANLAGPPIWATASKDGSNVAVAWGNGNGATVSIFHNNGSSWSHVSGGSALESTPFPNFTAIHFLSDGNLMVLDSNGVYENFWQFTNVGASVGSVYNAQNDFGSGWIIYDFGVSP
jgi:hypothetical protein